MLRQRKQRIVSRPLIRSDFDTKWYIRWASELKQDESHKGNFELHANKFWQNAIMAQILFEEDKLTSGSRGLVFGVGEERLPALFASYGVAITATDQDASKDKAKQWTNDQLAKGLASLNKLSICDDKKFKSLVEFEPADMRRIAKKYKGSYDFVWSNCALGHLGTIKKGLQFIIDSSECLLPGGIAVHTTELNILSNEETLDNRDTVFFRLKDIRDVAVSLSEKGYICKPFSANFKKDKSDLAFTLNPQWGTDHSKILFDGYMATQIVLIIKKPAKKLTSSQIRLQKLKHTKQYLINVQKMKRFLQKHAEFKYLAMGQYPVEEVQKISATALVQKKKITIKKGESKQIKLAYKNNADIPLFGITNKLRNSTIISLGTNNPINHDSQFAHTSWYLQNRPSLNPVSENQAHQFVMPDDEFSYTFVLDSGALKRGLHQEHFILVAEGIDAIPNSEVIVDIKII